MKSTILPLILFSSIMNFPLAKADQVTTPNATIYNDQSIYFISSNSVRVRSAPDGTGKILGELSLNDKVKIINPTVINNKFVEVSIILTYDPIVKAEKYFVSTDSLAPKIIDYKEFIGKYFVVVNVATETIRLYERLCADNSCPNKMIMESEVVVGEDIDHPKDEKGKGRSILGSYRVTGWTKFYQDPEGHYPAWYKNGYPDTPGPDANWSEWLSKKSMPLDEAGKAEGKMRGAFGWFTAFVAPEPYGQWTHGTLGWGSDKDKFIKRVKKPLINIVSDPRSSGCTRNNNEAIAFLRKMINIGAPIIKIYAKEEILDPTYKNYPNETEEWNYVMTKNRNHAVDREEVLKSLSINGQDLDAFWEAKRAGGALILDPKSPLNDVLEVGSYVRDVHPDVVVYTPGEKLGRFNRKIGRKGNVYGLLDKDMHGTFYIDAGMLEGYAHPEEVVEVSGFSDEVTPSWMKLSNLK
ncbi:MAG: L,D-transpeptidase [Bacteriovorax sp.]|nr:L,D-transpeptidase [Bacteriovorax sp.]